jgi:hypothetical protein
MVAAGDRGPRTALRSLAVYHPVWSATRSASGALTGDLGAGIFDGVSLVQTFEHRNPANTLWTSQYNLWSTIDTEPER